MLGFEWFHNFQYFEHILAQKEQIHPRMTHIIQNYSPLSIYLVVVYMLLKNWDKILPDKSDTDLC